MKKTDCWLLCRIKDDLDIAMYRRLIWDNLLTNQNSAYCILIDGVEQDIDGF